MKLNKLILLTSTCLISISRLYAGNPTNVKQLINHKDWNFVENKGQLTETDIKYYGHQGSVYLYCKPGMLSFVFTKTVNDEKISEATRLRVFDVGVQNFEPLHQKQPASARSSLSALRSSISTSRTDLVLINANPSAKIIANDQQEYYENYYTIGDADHGITNVLTYKTIIYKAIYPNIDMVLNCKEQGMEYSFIVHPGGKVSDIQLQWNGAEGIKKLKDSKIEYLCTLGKIEESAPKSFVEGKVVESRFIQNGFNYSFKVGSYDKSKDLVIDPTLVWGTYFGGTNTDGASAVSTDIHGDVYISGNTLSSTDISTPGAYKTSYSGSRYDGVVFLAKFDNSGAIQWATYYGGSGDEGDGIATDSSGNVYITGETKSSSGIATKGSYQSSLDGGPNAFLSKFSTNGTLQWATYYGRGSSYGSPGYTTGYGVATDGAGNVYMTGETESDSIITTNGAYQTYQGDGDAFLVKFSSTGTIKWATYYGGESGDNSRGIASDKLGNVYITGNTTSLSGIASNGAYQTALSGSNYNAFLAKFDSSGNRKWATYYGEEDELVHGVATDGSGNVYITGTSAGDSNLATPGAYQTSPGGGNYYDAFLAKFSSSGALTWSTYYGGSGDDQAYSVTTDTYGNVYITGSTSSQTGITTSGAYQTSLEVGSSYGETDAFLAEFNGSGGIKWATYLGASGSQSASSVTTDASGNVYITGNTSSLSGMATYGAYQFFNDGGTEDAFLAKFGFLHSDAGITVITSPDKAICPDSQKVIVKLKNYGSATLKKVDINWSVNKKVQPTYNWSGSLSPDSVILVTLVTFDFIPGVDTIRAWTLNPNGSKDSSPNNDSSSIFINVHSTPQTITGPTRTICKGTEISFGRTSPDSGTTYSWTTFPTGFTSTLSYIITLPASNIIYILKQTNSFGCSKIDSQKVIVAPRPNANWTINYKGDSAIFHAIDSIYPSYDYSWNFGDSTTIKHNYNVSHLFSKNQSYNITLQVFASSCVATLDSVLDVTKSGIKPELRDYHLNLFPNPFSESAILQYTLLKPSKVTVVLLDITGKEIGIVENKTQSQGKYSIDINAAKYNLSPGVYLLNFMTDDGYMSRQIVKF